MNACEGKSRVFNEFSENPLILVELFLDIIGTCVCKNISRRRQILVLSRNVMR
jgi:hypothetical protein